MVLVTQQVLNKSCTVLLPLKNTLSLSLRQIDLKAVCSGRKAKKNVVWTGKAEKVAFADPGIDGKALLDLAPSADFFVEQ